MFTHTTNRPSYQNTAPPPSKHQLVSNNLLSERIAITLANRIPITTPILAIIRRVLGVPSLAIERAVQPLRDGVLGQDVGVEEGTRLKATICSRVAAVVGRLHGAGLGTGRGVVALGLGEGEELVGHVGIAA